MSIKAGLALVLVAFALSACGSTPGKSDVQGALERFSKENPILFGSDKPIVKDTKCTKTGNDTFDCVTSLATSSDPQPHTITVKLTKLNGKWTAQITNLFG